ncbi:MAG TPA: TolC family protein, partial [Polyangiaceae bacterium]
MRYTANRAGRAFRVALLASALLASRVAGAQVLSLEELERRGVVQRASIAAAGARTDAARSAVALAEAPYHPTLSASVTGDLAPGGRLVHVTDTSGDDYLMTGSRAFGDPGALIPDFRYGAQLSLSGSVYDFGRTAANVRVRRAELAAAGFEQQAEALAVIREIRAAYLGWLAAFVARDIRRRAAAAARSLRESVEARVLEGSRPGANATPARSNETRLELEVEQAELELASARAELERAIDGKLPARAEPDASLFDQPATAAPPGRSLRDAALSRRREALSATAAAGRSTQLPMLS